MPHSKPNFWLNYAISICISLIVAVFVYFIFGVSAKDFSLFFFASLCGCLTYESQKYHNLIKD